MSRYRDICWMLDSRPRIQRSGSRIALNSESHRGTFACSAWTTRNESHSPAIHRGNEAKNARILHSAEWYSSVRRVAGRFRGSGGQDCDRPAPQPAAAWSSPVFQTRRPAAIARAIDAIARPRIDLQLTGRNTGAKMPKRSRPYEIGLNERLRDPNYAVGYLNAMWEDSVEG